MAHLIGGMASSHAFALRDPADWDEGRTANRKGYERRYGALPPEHPKTAQETDDDVSIRFAEVSGALDQIRDEFEANTPDVIILVGDDQQELFRDQSPQLAVYKGGPFIVPPAEQVAGEIRYQTHPALAEAILNEALESEIDLAFVNSFPRDLLVSHAFGPLLKRIDPSGKIPVIPVFVNAVNHPGPSPSRCYKLGQAIRRAIEGYEGSERVAICGSGGLSHFTAGYPYVAGDFQYNDIHVDFDINNVEQMRAGRGEELAKLSTRELLDNGNIEFRSWLVALGALGAVEPDFIVYQPFHRGLMGMGVGLWRQVEERVPARA
jgi:aromatic ring-opening dioxygenase catalytic subunit (LigB family)